MLKPTLGGIKILQKKLEGMSFLLPIFEIDIYGEKDFNLGWLRYKSGLGKQVDINRELEIFGPHKMVCDIRIVSKNRKYIIEFSDPWNCQRFPIPERKYFKIETTLFEEFKDMEWEIWNLARYGKTKPTRYDKFLLKFFPRFYEFPSFNGL